VGASPLPKLQGPVDALFAELQGPVVVALAKLKNGVGLGFVGKRNIGNKPDGLI
jgi:hypothetical protein